MFGFENIGNKIKRFSVAICWTLIILNELGSLISIIALATNEYTISIIWMPILAVIVNPFIIWIGLWAFYALGEMVESLEAIKINSAYANTYLAAVANNTAKENKQ